MRDRMLYDAMRQLTDDAARLLESRLRAGAEIPFEVGEASAPRQSSGTALFAYKPLTSEFVSSHADQLRALDSFENAANHLARTRGTVAYLRLREEPVLDVGELTHARLGVLAFLAAVWSDAEHFEPWDDRFTGAYRELESVALAERLVTTVFIPVHGVVLDCEVVNLGAGVELMSTEDLDADCLDRFSDAAEGADCYCAVSVDAPSNEPAPMAAVRRQARSLLTALRMFKPGSVSLGMTAQANVGGAWQQVALPFTGRSREEAWRLLPGEDEELRQFIGAVRRVERRTRVDWSLKRFEMGLERSVPAEGLTDFLAALRTLLEAHDDTGKSALPARVSALCARDSERVHVRATVEAAFALERLAVDGHIGRADRKRLAKQPPLEVIAETERYLRALLHDLVCGYLSTDLRKLADEILLADGEPTGMETASHDPVYLEPVPDPDAAPRPDPTATREFEAVFDDTAEITVLDNRFDTPVAAPASAVVPAAASATDGAARAAGAPAHDDDAPADNVWTLRPAAEVKPAPELSPDPIFDNAAEPPAARIPTYAEQETDTRMRQLAEELVSDFDDAFSRTMEADAVRPDDSPPPSASQHVVESPRPRDADPLPADAEIAVSPAGDTAEDGFTFDFKVVDAPSPPAVTRHEPPRERDPNAKPIAPSPDADFSIREFELPEERGPVSEEVDDEVDGGRQRRDFRQIMDENFTPPPRDLSERPSTPLARNGRPHLVAIDGNAAREPLTLAPAVNDAAAEDPGSTVEFDVLADFDDDGDGDVVAIEPAWSNAFADGELATDAAPRVETAPAVDAASPIDDLTPAADPPPPAAPAPSSERARTQAIGPATIEFRPLVDPDADDPDDFAGAC